MGSGKLGAFREIVIGLVETDRADIAGARHVWRSHCQRHQSFPIGEIVVNN